MKSSRFAVPLIALVVALPAGAQDDRVILLNGTKVDGVHVTAYDIRTLRYSKGGTNESVPTDQVAKVELGKFTDVYRRGLKDPDMMLTVAREQLEAKNTLMAQMGFVGASAQFFDANKPAEGVGTLEEMQKAIPEAGVVPEVHRQKFEYYMGIGGKGAPSALAVAKKYQADAVGGAWPPGFGIEAEFFLTLAERGKPQEFQAKLRGVIAKATGGNAMIANRANVELAHSLREAKDVEGAQRIYDDLAKRDGVDSSSRAGAFLGTGMILLDKGTAVDKDVYKKALLMFLRVRLETRDAWPSLQADALYHAILAADKWRGPEYTYIMARCRGVLFNEFGDTDWARRAKEGR